MSPPTPIFDIALHRRRLARAHRIGAADYLLRRVATDMSDRLLTVNKRFHRCLDVGTPSTVLIDELRTQQPQLALARVAPLAEPGAIQGGPEHLPAASERFDLIVSALALHAVDDLPGALVQMRRALEPDGLLLASLIGVKSLNELRTVLTEADLAESGGASPRIAPFADVRDMGGLLQRAGFALPVADTEQVTVRFDNMFALIADLRAMGATNILRERQRHFSRRATFQRAAALYAERFADGDGRIRATFEIISVSGWAPHQSQQKPAARGSATVRLTDALRDLRAMPTSSDGEDQ